MFSIFSRMCQAVTFQFNGEQYTIDISHPRPALPVLMPDQSSKMFPWGRHSNQPGTLPFGFTAKRDAVLAGRWDKWFPRRVLIPNDAYMLLNFEGKPKWYPNAMKTHLVGLMAKNPETNERRVYVVVQEPDIVLADYHDISPVSAGVSYR